MIQLCGKVPLDAKRSLQLVRVGQRLLVLLESPQGMQRLAEISDPTEVARILGGDYSLREQRPA
jgi:flagellar biogenesis protein FliO